MSTKTIMTNVITLSKKAFTWSVVLMTIAWSVGLAALAPAVTYAAECPDLDPGTDFKTNSSNAVWHLDQNLEKLGYPQGFNFLQYHGDFSGVVEIDATCFDNYADSDQGFVTYFPGTLYKRVESPRVYVMGMNNKSYPLESAEVAAAYFGANWATRVRDVLSAYAQNIDSQESFFDGSAPLEGMLVRYEGNTYQMMGGMLKKVEGDLPAGALATAIDASEAQWAVWTEAGAISVETVTASFVTANPAQTMLGGSTTPAPEAPVANGNLSVSLSGENPAGASLPRGATNVDVLKFNVKAGNTPVVLDEVSVKRTGVGETTGLTAYLYEGDMRIGSAKTFSSDDNMAEFSVLDYTVPANTTKTLTIRLKVGSTAVGNHFFSLSGMEAKANISGLPVMGNQFFVEQSVTAGTLNVVKNGTLSNPTLGDSNAQLTRFELTAQSEDQDLMSFTLKQDGTVDTNHLSKLTLWRGTEQVPATVSVSGRLVTFSLQSPYLLADGSGRVFTVKGDISSDADTGDTIIMYVDRDTDFNAVGRSYGFGTLASIEDFNAAGDAHTLTLQGGGLTIANNSKPAHDVKTDSTEVELARVAMKATSDNMEIQKMTATLATVSSTSGGFNYGTFKSANATYEAANDTLLVKNVKLKDADTGKTLGSAKAITEADDFAAGNDVDATLTFIWTDYFTIKKGETRNVIMVADIDDDQISEVKHTATFKFATANFTVRDSKDNAVTDIVPASDIAGNQLTTKTAGLTVSRAATPESRTVVAGSEVDALGLIFAAASGEGNDVKVSALTLDMYVDGNLDDTFALNAAAGVDAVKANTLVETVSLYADGEMIAGPVGVESNGTVVFTSNNFVGGFYEVMSGTNKNVVVRVKTSGNAPFGGNDDAFSYTMNAADITVEDANGTITAEVTGTNVNGTTAPSVAMTITGNGTITVSADSGRPDASILVAGKDSEQEVNRIRLNATKEAFNVSKMAILVTSTATTTIDNVEYVQLYTPAGQQLGPVGGVVLNAAGVAEFNGLSLNVPVSGNTIVVVKAKMKDLGERTTATDGTAGVGADSGDDINFNVDTTAGNFRAVGASSGTVDEQADAATSRTHIVRNTKPTVAISSLPSDVLSNGERVLMRFTVTADAEADVVLGSIKPYITFNDADADDSLVMSAETLFAYDVTSNETKLNDTGANALATSSSEQYLITFDNDEVVTIAAGTTRTFEVRGTFTGTESNDSVETKFVRDAASLSSVYNTETLADAVADANNDFIWSDSSADTNGVGSVEWVNGYLLQLPTTPSTLSRS